MSKILFVCSANHYRSRQAEEYFGSRKEYSHHSFESAGLNYNEVDKVPGAKRCELQDLLSADIIYVMQNHHKNTIRSSLYEMQVSDNVRKEILNKTYILSIKDDYKTPSSLNQLNDIFSLELGGMLKEKENHVILKESTMMFGSSQEQDQ